MGLAVAGFFLGREVLDGTAITVPDLKLLPRAEAVGRLRALGLRPQTAGVHRGDVDAGLVVAQRPPPGARSESGAPVRIVVSKGPRLVAVPDIIGEDLSEAEDQLAERGLALQEAGELHSFEREGAIVLQFPSHGTTVERGSVVAVVVSTGFGSEDDD
jgi:serine/threonine-protein kinase